MEKPRGQRTRSRWIVGVVGVAIVVTAALWLRRDEAGDRASGERLAAREAAASVVAPEQSDPEAAPGPVRHGVEAAPEPRAERERAQQDADEIAPGELAVFVRDDAHALLPAVGVRFVSVGRDKRDPVLATTDATGWVTRSLPPGRHRVEVEPSTLPARVLPPFGQTKKTYGPPVPGLGPTIVDVASGARHEIEIVCLTPATVRGRVVLGDGQPVEGAMVRLQGRHAEYLPGLHSDAYTDAGGHYVMTNVHPADYRVQIELVSCGVAAIRALPNPVPFAFDVSHGGEHVVRDVVLTAGDRTLRGRIVDELGVPIAGVVVACHPTQVEGTMRSAVALGRVTTDADGRFEFAGLHPAVVRIAAPDDFSPSTPVLGRKTAFFLEPVIVDLGASPIVDVGDLHLDRSRPLIVRGTVELDPGFRAQTDVEFEDLVLVARVAPGFVRPPTWPRRTDPRDERVAIDPSTGAFEYVVETPHPPVLLELRLERAPQGVAPVTLTLDGTLPRVETVILGFP
jgi:protocatechuate 3,4-dioxygenase beta subunit